MTAASSAQTPQSTSHDPLGGPRLVAIVIEVNFSRVCFM